MQINDDHEIEVFDRAYRLGFRAGQLAWRRRMIEGSQRIEAKIAGGNIAITRGNVSLEEYIQLEKENQL